MELDQTGFWRVLRGEGREQRIAVNIDRRESDLAPAPAEALAMWSSGAALGQQPGGGQPPARPLARWLLLAALLAALVETVLASSYPGREAA